MSKSELTRYDNNTVWETIAEPGTDPLHWWPVASAEWSRCTLLNALKYIQTSRLGVYTPAERRARLILWNLANGLTWDFLILPWDSDPEARRGW